MIDGNVVKRATLTANTEEIITFDVPIQSICLMAKSGTVYYKTDDSISSVDDSSANFIDSSVNCVDIYKNKPFSTIHLFTSDTGVMVQWDIY